MNNDYIGIDYGMGLANRDPENMEMHYGVISSHAVSSYALENMESDYGDASCPDCQAKAEDYADYYNSLTELEQEDVESWKRYNHYECDDYCCLDCEIIFGSESAYPEEPHGFYYEDEKLKVHGNQESTDLWILKSEYYTLCAYCSPCAPGAGCITSQRENGIKTYCLPLEWFNEEESKCPYKIYRVSDDTLVYSPEEGLTEEDEEPEEE